MIEIRVGTARAARALALPVCPFPVGADLAGGRPGGTGATGPEGGADKAMLVPTGAALPEPLADELAAFLADVPRPGAAGAANLLPRPGRDPGHVLLVGVGAGDAAGWRAAGAALVRAASSRLADVTFCLPTDGTDAAAKALAEGAWLASYRFRLVPDSEERRPRLRQITLATTRAASNASSAAAAVAQARAVADAVFLARDLTNTPSAQKSPQWFADRVSHAAARRSDVEVTVHDEGALTQMGFGGILAVGSGSARPPRLVEMAWRPRRARAHVMLVGKGITFDSGGISIKSAEGMKIMRKDMGGAATVCAALLGAADLRLPVRITALIPLAENMISGSAWRPGDVVRHYGGLTSEVQSTDSEGRVVLGDALAYAARRFRPSVVVDVATLTGAAGIALGKRTAALFTENDELARSLAAAGDAVGERMWRLPLANEYVPMLASDVADLNNAPMGGGGAVTAALYLREFTGRLRERWAHVDMSAASWTESNDGVLVKGATGWGVRMLLEWLTSLTEPERGRSRA